MLRAQRLSASEGKTHVPEPAKPERNRVLNAFRHQREKHMVTVSPSTGTPGAQRLSASEGKTPTKKNWLFRLECGLEP